MAAYAALLSVMHIIETLHNHPRPPITIDKALTQSLTEKIAFLQDFLESYNFHGGSEELESLQSRIADAAHAAEDVIESHIVDQIFARSRSTHYGEETTGFECLQKLIKAMDFIKRQVMEIINEKVDFTEQTHIALNKKQVESEKIAILLDFIEYYNSHEVQCLLNRIANAAEDSVESDTADQIVTEKIGTLQTLFRAYNSHGDECLRTRIANAAYAAEENIESNLVGHIFGLSIDCHVMERTPAQLTSINVYRK